MSIGWKINEDLRQSHLRVEEANRALKAKLKTAEWYRDELEAANDDLRLKLKAVVEASNALLALTAETRKAQHHDPRSRRRYRPRPVARHRAVLRDLSRQGVDEAMSTYTVRYERDERGWWVARVLGLPGCHTQGRSIAQARERIREALSLLVEDAEKSHVGLPHTLDPVKEQP